MKKAIELRELLKKIDRKGYPAYKETRGQYQFSGYVLSIDHVQGDPFAAPSKVSVQVKGTQAEFPKQLYDKAHKRIALQDYLLRQFGREVSHFAFQAKGSGKSGLMSVSCPGQEILERSACVIQAKTGDILLRLEIGFPANGRTINARELEKILFEFLPECIKKSLYYKSLNEKQVQQVMELSEDQQYIREELKKRNLCAFVADGSILPRESGVSQKPMRGAIKFQSPESLRVSLELPYHGTLTGMGVPNGITLIVGGGYHGKSTLLKALEMGVYNHVVGDGREYVITDSSAMKIRAEDGRSIKNTDVSMFINHLPNGKDTKHFSTEDASGSTSQAANVIEAMEAGTGVFLIDEDTSATNFMIRDELMQRVVSREAEPITPFIDRIEELYESYGISTILVAGSSGSYFHKADVILQMEQYIPRDITNFAKQEAESVPIPVEKVPKSEILFFERKLDFSIKGKRDDDRIKIKVQGKDGFFINHENVDLRYLEQIADVEQVTALGYILKYAAMKQRAKKRTEEKKTLQQLVTEIEQVLEQQGLSGICDGNYLPAGLAMPRKQEVFACLNRWRGKDKKFS